VPFSQKVKDQVWRRAGKKCQCTSPSCAHHRGRDCDALLEGDAWEAHRITSQDDDTVENCAVLCRPCYDAIYARS
jgi:hypothetical protein